MRNSAGGLARRGREAGNREDAELAWGKRRMQWRQTLGTEFAGQWNLRATGRGKPNYGKGKGNERGWTGRGRIGEAGRGESAVEFRWWGRWRGWFRQKGMGNPEGKTADTRVGDARGVMGS